MELDDALRTTGAVREFRDEPVPDDVLYRVLDAARFAPNGGNRQGWRVVVVHDRATRVRIRDLYLSGWRVYLAQVAAGLTPWGPLTDRAAEGAAIAAAEAVPDGERPHLGGFAETLDTVPALLVVLADLRVLAAVDRDLDRYTFVGGASVYPFTWSLLLAAHGEGLGGVITTMAVHREAEMKALLEVPDDFALAAVVALGYPERRPTRLRREPVASFTTVDRFGGFAFP